MKQKEVDKDIIRLTNRISDAILHKRFPNGQDIKDYFGRYDFYRTRRISHLVPRGAKNLKLRLIQFLIDDLNLPARVSVDPIQRIYGHSRLSFNKLIMIALPGDMMVGFHVEESKYTELRSVDRQKLPVPRHKNAIADFFDREIAAGRHTAKDFRLRASIDDPFNKYEELGNV
jgi:hypothetical protein